MWLEWLSHTLSASRRVPPMERGRRLAAEAVPELAEHHPVGGTATGGTIPAPLVASPILLGPVEPHRS
ncbi:MAG TPA: hypothetical protein VMU85_22875 [Stellaceae bacterium]|nr:hypothetical protein [Stellaceae bacterium]